MIHGHCSTPLCWAESAAALVATLPVVCVGLPCRGPLQPARIVVVTHQCSRPDCWPILAAVAKLQLPFSTNSTCRPAWVLGLGMPNVLLPRLLVECSFSSTSLCVVLMPRACMNSRSKQAEDACFLLLFFIVGCWLAVLTLLLLLMPSSSAVHVCAPQSLGCANARSWPASPARVAHPIYDVVDAWTRLLPTSHGAHPGDAGKPALGGGTCVT